MEKWSIDLWITEDRICRVERDLLKTMNRKDKFLFASLEEKMKKYVQEAITRVQALGDLEKVKSERNMWELKFHLYRKNEIRFLGCLIREDGFHTFYALYAFKKKEQCIKNRHRDAARGRVAEFINYLNNQNGLQEIL